MRWGTSIGVIALLGAAALGAAGWHATGPWPQHARPGAVPPGAANANGPARASATITGSLGLPPKYRPGLLEKLPLAHREPDPAWRPAAEFPEANTRYGFAFDLPEGVAVERTGDLWYRFSLAGAEVSGDLDTIGRSETASAVEDWIGSDASEDPFRDFALLRARAQCDADGPDGGTRCDSARPVREFATASGLRALEITLVMTDTRYVGRAQVKRETTRTVGPLYAVDVSRQGRLSVLVITGGVHEPQSAAQVRLAERIARSVALTRECEIAAEDARAAIR